MILLVVGRWVVLISRREFLFCVCISYVTLCLYVSEYIILIEIPYRAVPTYLNPYMYKRDSEGEILLDRGDEYYDDSIPYDGVYIHFAKQIMEVSRF